MYSKAKGAERNEKRSQLLYRLKDGDTDATVHMLKYVKMISSSLANAYSKIFNLEYEETNDEIVCHLYTILKTSNTIDNDYFLLQLKNHGKSLIYNKISAMYGLQHDDIDFYYNLASLLMELELDMEFVLNNDEYIICDMLCISYNDLYKFKTINSQINDKFLSLYEINFTTPPTNEIDIQIYILDLETVIAKVINTLEEDEKTVLSLRFGLSNGVKKSLRTVSEELDLSQDQIRRIEAKALRKLRHPSRSKYLKNLL